MNLIHSKIRLRDTAFEVTAEQASEHFAITPALYREGGQLRIGSGTVLTHIESGIAFSSDSFIDQRKLAADLEVMSIDWGTWTTETKPTADEIADIKRVIHRHVTSPNYGDDYQWPAWAGDASTPALSLLAKRLDLGLDTDFWAKASDIRDDARPKLGEEAARKLDTYLIVAGSMADLSNYGLIYLLAVLRRVNPEAADRAASDLVAEFESGDGVAEWIGQWRQELAQGKPLTLHGFPAVPFVDGGAE